MDIDGVSTVLGVLDTCVVAVAVAVICCVCVLLASLLRDCVRCGDFVGVVVGGGLRLSVSVCVIACVEDGVASSVGVGV